MTGRKAGGRRLVFAFVLLPLLVLAGADTVWSQSDPTFATPLKMADPSTFPAARSEREGIEKAILRGDPASLDAADLLISKSRQLSVSELGALKAVAAAFREAIYPDTVLAGLGSGVEGSGKLPSETGSILAAPGGLSVSVSSAPNGVGIPGSPLQAASAYKVLSPLLSATLACLPLFGSDATMYSGMALEAAANLDAAGMVSVLPGLFRGKVAEIRADYRGASEQYRAALAAFPNAWPAALGLARCELSLSHYPEAAAVIDALDPETDTIPQVLSLGAMVLHANGRLSEAFVQATRFLEFLPGDPTSRLIRAHYLAESGEYQIALGILANLPKPESSSRLYFELRSLVAQGMKNLEEMLSWARKGLDAYPDDPGLLVLAAKALFSGPESGFSQAESYARRALSVLGVANPTSGPEDTPSRDLTGPLLEAAGLKVTRVPSPLEEARLAKAGREASRLLIVASTLGNNWNDAFSYMDLAGQLSVDRKTQASILRNTGRIQDALAYSQAWYKEESGSEDALEAYLRALLISGKSEEAGNLVSSLPAAGTSSRLGSYLLYLKGRMALSEDEALRCYRAALFEQADDVDALVALSEIHLRLNEPERASFYFSQAALLGTNETELSLRISALRTAMGAAK